MNLQETLRQRQFDAMVADARFLRSQPASEERGKLLATERTRAMCQFALSRITLEERDTILAILDGKNIFRINST